MLYLGLADYKEVCYNELKISSLHNFSISIIIVLLMVETLVCDNRAILDLELSPKCAFCNCPPHNARCSGGFFVC